MSDEATAIVNAIDAVTDQVSVVGGVLDYVLFVACLGLGALLWRLAVLGKNQRTLWLVAGLIVFSCCSPSEAATLYVEGNYIYNNTYSVYCVQYSPYSWRWQNEKVKTGAGWRMIVNSANEKKLIRVTASVERCMYTSGIKSWVRYKLTYDGVIHEYSVNKLREIVASGESCPFLIDDIGISDLDYNGQIDMVEAGLLEVGGDGGGISEEDSAAIVSSCDTLGEKIVEIKGKQDYVLFIVCLGLGALFWRLAVLGKNQRNLW